MQHDEKLLFTCVMVNDFDAKICKSKLQNVILVYVRWYNVGEPNRNSECAAGESLMRVIRQ